MIIALLAFLALLGPLAYFLGADSRTVDERETRRWL
jgi:hypothetical protein